MASGILCSLCLLLLVNFPICNGLDFSYKPKDNIVGGRLQLVCSGNVSSDIDNLQIKRGSLVLIDTDPNVRTLDPSVIHWKYKIVNSPMLSLEVVIDSLACSDNGTFVCVTMKNGAAVITSNDLSLNVRAPPENVEIRSNFIILPDKEIESPVGKQIHLICSSYLGNPPGQAHWLLTNDVSKPETFRVITENVSGSDPKVIPSSCQTKMKLSLKYYPNREMKLAIKCSVNNTVGEGSFMRVYNIVKKEEKDSSKLIIIVVLCVIIPEIIIAIILGVVLYIRRSRAKKRAEEALAKEAAEQKNEGEYSNIPLKSMNRSSSSVGGRRNRDPRYANDQEKQAMTAYEDDPEA